MVYFGRVQNISQLEVKERVKNWFKEWGLCDRMLMLVIEKHNITKDRKGHCSVEIDLADVFQKKALTCQDNVWWLLCCDFY